MTIYIYSKLVPLEPFDRSTINCSIVQQSWANWGEIIWAFTPTESWAVCCWNLCVLFKNVQVDDVDHDVGTEQKLPRDAVSVPEQSQWDCSHKHFGKLSFQKNHFAGGLCHVVAVPHPCMWFGLVGQWQWFGDKWELCPVCITGWAEVGGRRKYFGILRMIPQDCSFVLLLLEAGSI